MNLATKLATKHVCVICDYECSKLSDMTKHESTRKHKISVERYNEDTKTRRHEVPLDKCFKCGCGRTYLYHSGLWRHQKQGLCSSVVDKDKTVDEDPDSIPGMPDIQGKSTEEVCGLLKQMVMSQNLVIQLLKEQAAIPTTVNNNTMNATTTNNNININMFLKEHCKDAVTFDKFLKSIDPTVDDVLYLTEHGNRRGMSKIINNAFGKLEITERPIHCTDLKRHTTYVKESDGWVKEQDQKHMKQLCDIVEHGCIKRAVEIMNSNPNYRKSGTDEYEEGLKMMMETNSGIHTNHVALMKDLEESAYLNRMQLQDGGKPVSEQLIKKN